MYKIERTSPGNDFNFVLLAEHGHTILKSNFFDSVEDVKKQIESVKTNALNMSRYERKTTSDGKFYFNLTNASGAVLGRSQTYSSEAGMENGILAVKSNAHTLQIQLPS
ncbi:YegP family protein [Galbibacter sp.]|jgi:uncharacterized protein YegP (UPF0339 family)|uniref:YegP family protein n=1 Tax=Galbibacter sp. TaxID=2918471 RepID=UPI003A909E70